MVQYMNNSFFKLPLNNFSYEKRVSSTRQLNSFSCYVLTLGILKLGGYDVLDNHIPHSLDVGDHLSNGSSIRTQIYHMTICDVDDAKESTLLLTFW